jgi:hypothetical protein
MVAVVDLTAGQTAGRDRAQRERANEPERLAHKALLTLDPDRAGLDPRLVGKDYLRPNIAASAAERVDHVGRFSPDALAMFGPDVLLAAAKLTGKDGGICRWCWSARTARVHDRATPYTRVGARPPNERSAIRRAFVHLIGGPCSNCKTQLDAEAKKCDAIRLAQRAKRRAPAAPALTAALAGKTPAELRQVMNTLAIRVHATRVRSTRRDERLPIADAGKSLVDMARHRALVPW